MAETHATHPDWTYDVYTSYGRVNRTDISNGNVSRSAVPRLLNATDGGASLCAGGFNPFSDAKARSLSPQCVDFITKDAFSKEDLDQTQVQAQVNGKLFDLPAGAVQVAVVADYRRNTYA